ncbi:MAG: response regulator [Eubacterium sp.]|jgi:signal transduction histidine kinase/CheY-like chemotaxis protein|nr:response regulator [Eubacterium sp.]
MIKMGIKSKILIPAIAITLIVAAAILAFNIISFSSFVDASTIERVGTSTKVVNNRLDSLKLDAKAVSSSISNNPNIISAAANKNREELLVYARTLQNDAEIDFCTITDSSGVVIVRTHAPDKYGDSVLSQENIKSALYGQPLTVIEKGTVVSLSVRSGTPIIDDKGNILGVVSAGYRLDTERFVDSIKDTMGCEITIVLGDDRISTTILREDGTRAVGTKADAWIAETVLAGNSYSGRIDILGRTAVARYTPIEGPNGQAIGMIFVGQYFDEELQTIWTFVQGGLIITFIIMVVSSAVILIVLGRIVTPIRAMTDAASALAVGDTDLEIDVNTNDEMRTLADAFNSMIDNTRRQVEIVEHIANGDLTVSLQVRSEKDIMNRALEKLSATIRTQNEMIRKEYERIQLMMDATPLASRLWDKDYNLIECNEAAVKLFNLKDKQEYINRYYELSPKYQSDGQETREKVKDLVKEAFDKGICNYDWLYLMPDGTPMPSEVTMVRVPYGDDYVVAGYSRDLREQKKMLSEIEERDRMLQAALEEAKNANNAKGDFLAKISHEMRTPLNAIIGLSEITLDNLSLDVDAKSNLEKIYNSGSTLLSIVNDILDISKIQSGKFEIFPNQYDVPSMVNDAVLQNVLRIGSRPIQFVLDIDDCMLARLFGDELRIKQIISNLLSNAIKYTEEGMVKLGIGCERSGDDVWMTIRVSDTGIGIRTEHVDKLFSDYEQLGDTSFHQVGGTGLGLAITKRLAEAMDGSINVKSEYGSGSVFTVKIRQSYVNDTVIGIEVMESLKRFQYSASKLNRNSHTNRIQIPYARVLVVDDNITNLDVAKGLLKPYGMGVDCVTGGQDAIRAIRDEKTRYNAIFMDHMMPGMDGIEAAKIIREEIGTEYAKNIPIIALTANAVAGSEDVFLSKGFQAFISKPIDIAKLDSVINHWIRNKSLEKTERQNIVSSVIPSKDYLDFTAPDAEILIVDDNETNLKVATELMKPLQMRIDTASGGAEALRMVRQKQYDIIFMDHMMPEMDGIETVTRLRQTEDEYYHNVPVIALTANENSGVKEKFLLAGMNDFVSKPINIKIICEKVKKWLPKKLLHDKDLRHTINKTDELPVIDGINTADGVRYSGTKELFISLLGDFYKIIDLKADKIEKYLTDGKLRDLTIEVHALKNTARTIGARELYKGFLLLEQYGNEEDIDALKREMPAVMEQYRGFKKILRPFGKAQEHEKKATTAKELIALLEKIKFSMRSFDLGSADEALESLEKLQIPEECKAHVEMLSAYVSDVAIAEVMELTEVIIEIIKKYK